METGSEMERTKKSKNKKRFTLLIILMVLLTAVITTGSITFAKYIVLESIGSRHATVAKWGFTVEIDASNLFGDAYRDFAKVSYDESSVDVKASTANTNLVAPGTSGSLTFTIGGTAEVYSRFTVEASENPKDVVLEEIGAEKSRFYYPVKWTLKRDGAPLLTDVRLKEIADELNGYSRERINPGEELDCAGTYTIEWRWDFNDSEELNKKDTVIGQIANGGEFEKYRATTDIEFALKIGMEQIRAPEDATA